MPREPNLLTPTGEIDEHAITHQVELELFTRFGNDSIDQRARRREMTRDVWRGVACQQAARFGKDAIEVAILNLEDQRFALAYAGHLNRDQRDAEHIRIDREIAALRARQAGRLLIQARLGEAA